MRSWQLAANFAVPQTRQNLLQNLSLIGRVLVVDPRVSSSNVGQYADIRLKKHFNGMEYEMARLMLREWL